MTRSIGTLFVIAGLIMMIFILQVPTILWVAWPSIAAGGVVNHMVNVQMCRAIPKIATSLQALTSGALGSAASLPLLLTLLHDPKGPGE